MLEVTISALAESGHIEASQEVQRDPNSGLSWEE